MSGRTFRPANPDDLDRLVEIHMASYADSRGAEARRRNFLHNPLGTYERDLWVCREGSGDIVGHAFLFSLRMHFSGRVLPVGGVASVGVAPEARRTGVASALMEHLHAIALARGDVLTVLYAFRDGFYRRLGYAPATPSQRLVFSPDAVPKSWRGKTRAAKDRAEIESIFAKAASKSTGMIERPPLLWDAKFSNERRHVIVTDGGYVAYELAQDEAHAETRLLVQELVAITDDARRTLVGVLGAQGDHASEIELSIPMDDPLALALVDPDRRRFGTLEVEHATGMTVSGPMLRPTSVEKALQARDDVRVAIDTDPGTLGVLLFGGWKISEAVRLGLVKTELADEVLAHPRYFNPDTF